METKKQPWIAEFYEKEKVSADSDKTCGKAEKASDFLCRSFETCVESLNKEYGRDAISVVAPPRGFMHAVFDADEETRGFLLLFGTSKLVMVFCGDGNAVTFVGRKIDSDSQSQKKNLKLLGATWEETEDGKYLLRDSTGVEIEIRELVLRIIRWGTG
ncbi:MAG: hypothetical protein OXK19_02210 [Candidatus Dadabacteria bacterium]|nr:hypothetical protein [Candidatus Dadabacteria bacterium]